MSDAVEREFDELIICARAFGKFTVVFPGGGISELTGSRRSSST